MVRSNGFSRLVLVWVVCFSFGAVAQSASSAVVPQLVSFSGKATDPQGKPIAGIAGITFAIYNSQYDGNPLWTETQNVTADANGNYTVQLGAATANGLPLDLFSSGEARWLGVRINGGEEQARVLLLSVPYALKAADAETLGGLPPSAFALAAPAKGLSTASQGTATDVTTGAIAIPLTGTPTLSGNNVFTGNNTFEPSSSVDAVDAYTSGAGKTALVGLEYATSGGSYGVYAVTYDGTGAGVAGRNFGTNTTYPFTSQGVYGYSSNGYGVEGMADSGEVAGVYGVGQAGSGARGVIGIGGTATGNIVGGYGIAGQGATSPAGDGEGAVFSGGNSTRYGDGVDAEAGSGYAGYFTGNVEVTGSVAKSGGSFKIDHPLDPANKYLSHSFVESPDMMNIYNGNITTDSSGEATVTLPDWFEVLNRDFRYQLTVIGQFAQAIVDKEIEGSQFQIKTSLPNVKVSWQVTGIRQDAWANAHRIPVEEEKEAGLKGFYIHPELHGAPPEKQIQWARHPQTMKEMQRYRQSMKEQKMVPVRDSATAEPRLPLASVSATPGTK